ncbi:uncharacterized ATPase, AAA superfamily [Nanoarchaeota archaeon]
MDIKTYLVTKKEDIKNINVKPRLKEINITKDFIHSIIGPRRSGKSFYLYYLIKKLNLKEEDYLFVNFEDYVDFKDPFDFLIYHKEIYGKDPEYLFFDEIQNLNNWEKFVYTLYESKRYYIFITGSSSKLLSKEIATSLRGRSISINIYPLSFKEIFFYENVENKKLYSIYEEGKIRNIVNKYIYSQFPDIIFNNINPSDFFKIYLDLIVYKDIIDRYGIKNRYALELFIKSAITSFTKEFSIRKLFNTLRSQNIKVSKNLLYNFQKILEDIQIFFFLRNYSKSLRKLELSIPKIHLVDPGLYNYIIEKDIGKTLENIVFLEFIKNGLEINKNIFYFENNNYEIDFLIKEGNRITKLINVSYVNNFDEIDKREIRSLIHSYELFKEHNPELIIITWDYEDEKEISWFNKKGKIKFIPLYKWLLNI